MLSLRFSVIFSVSILAIAVAIRKIEGSVISEATQCTRECTTEKLECSNECKMGEEAVDKQEVLMCLGECKTESESCEQSCTCISKCGETMQTCEKKCNTNTTQDVEMSEDCLELCEEETEQCMDLCEL